MDDTRVAAYLARIGAVRPTGPEPAALSALQRAHLFAAPFENLSIHLGDPIVLDEAALLEKIVDRRRGGFCYELNGAFAALLTALGYRVTLLQAQVFSGADYGPPFDHLALRIDLAEPFLVDVGFGAFSHTPLRLDDRAEQRDGAGTFRLSDLSSGHIGVAFEGKPQYRLDPRPYRLRDFIPTCWFQQSSPDSHFTRSLTCSLPTASGRITLSGSTLIRTVNGERQETELADGDILAAYREHFGVALDRIPALSRDDHAERARDTP